MHWVLPACERKLAYGLNAALHKLGLADEFRCYAQRYPALLNTYCPRGLSNCNWVGLQQHWDSTGRDVEGRTTACPRASRS